VRFVKPFVACTFNCFELQYLMSVRLAESPAPREMKQNELRYDRTFIGVVIVLLRPFVGVSVSDVLRSI
jgi:hypothetical protein